MKILLLGHGVANDGVALLLDKLNIVYDYKDIPEVEELSYQVIVKSPGINYREDLIDRALDENIIVISDIEMIYWFVNRQFIGITGSNGKTTTTTILTDIINQKYKAVACGNIGYALGAAAAQTTEETTLVCELSSFQLKGVKLFSPHFAIITNITPSHLDYHNTFEDYVLSKEKIVINQTENDYVIYNLDNKETVSIASISKANKYSFSKTNNQADCYLYCGAIFFKKQFLFKIKCLPISLQNAIEDVMAAVICGLLMGIAVDDIVTALKNFKGISYRLEKISTNIYNDAKSTNPFSTIHAISNLCKPLRLICGGYDRKEDLSVLDNHLKNIIKVYAYGESSAKVEEYFKSKNIDIEIFSALKEATATARKELSKKELLLYSPMFASYDQYKSYKERGAEFSALINNK